MRILRRKSKSALSTVDLLESTFKEEGLDLTSFQDRKKQKKWKRVRSFFKAIPELFNNKESFSAHMLICLGSLVLALILPGFYLISPADVVWHEDSLFPIIKISFLVFAITTVSALIHAYLLFRKNEGRDDEESEQEDGVQTIFSSLNSYIETKRKEVIHRISQEKAELEKEKALMDAEITSLTKLIDEDTASGLQKQYLIEDREDLENQKYELFQEIESLKKFRNGMNKGIDFLLEESSPKISWSLRAAEASRRANERLRQSEVKLERSRQVVKDTALDFAQLYGFVTGKLEQINNISGKKLVDSAEVLDLSKLDEFLPEETAA